MTLKIFAICCALSLSSGCGAGYIKNFGSKPVLGGEHPPKSHIVKLENLDLYIRPYNDFRDFEMWNVMLIPVYISKEDKPIHRERFEFNLLLAYLPREPGFLLDPEKINLELNDKKIGSTVVSEWVNTAPKRGDPWSGYCGEPIPDSYQRIPSKPPPKDEENNWHCYQLKFDIETPHPDQEFSLTIDGMSLNGAKYQVPIIHFKMYDWYDHQPLI